MYQLAQMNIAYARAPLDDPRMTGFVAQIAAVNAAADAAPGFVWRLDIPDPERVAREVYDDPAMLINVSMWENVEALRDFVYRGTHSEPLLDRERWFRSIDAPHSVLWWVEAGHRPDPIEEKQRLDILADRGATPDAFTFAKPFPPPGQPGATPR